MDITFNAWTPSITFKKTSPPPPSIQLCVIDERAEPMFPSLSQLANLLSSVRRSSDFEGHAKTTLAKAGTSQGRMKKTVQMLKNEGEAKVHIALEQDGTISFLQLASIDFAACPLV